MKFRIEKSLDRDISKINDKNLLQKLRTFVFTVEKVNSLTEIPQVKKLRGYDSFYRIKIGDYRLGIELTPENEIICIRFLHRKEIYRYFPKRR